MKAIRRTIIVLVLTLLISGNLFASYLYFEQTNKGWLSRHGLCPITKKDNPSTPEGYENSNEYYNEDPYLGRVVYVGDPTTIEVINVGPIASSTSNNRFYFTKEDNTNRWREVFIVVRVWGCDHSNNKRGLHHLNIIIEHPGDTFTIPYGAGLEEVPIGEFGFSDSVPANGIALSTKNNGTNGFKYKYPYQYIWVDILVVRTDVHHNLLAGNYETHFRFCLTNGLETTFHLHGKWSTLTLGSVHPYVFTVEPVCNHFSFCDIAQITDVQSALHVGNIYYMSEELEADVTISSSPDINATDFKFVSSYGSSFPYNLVFEPILPAGQVRIVRQNNTIATTSAKVAGTSPMGTDIDAYRLEGKIKLYLDSAINPCAGNYDSTIYFRVTSK